MSDTSSNHSEPIHVQDQPSVRLDASIVEHDGKQALQLAYEGTLLPMHGGFVENGLQALSEYEVRVPDFVHDGRRYRVTVLAVQPDGSLQPWSRDDQDCVSPKIPRPSQGSVDHFFVVVAVRDDGGHVLADPYPGTRSVTMLTTGGG